MFRSTCSATLLTSLMSRPSPTTVRSTIVRDAGRGELVQADDRLGHCRLLVPTCRPVLLDLGREDEHVLVHEGHAETVGVDRPENCLYLTHDPPFVRSRNR